VKTAEDIVKKRSALFFLVIYFFMVSTYILHLPKYNTPQLKTSTASTIARLHHDNSSNDLYIQIHGIKAVPENKRKAIDFLIKTGSLVFLLIFSGVTLPGWVRRSALSPGSFQYAHLHHYLNFGVLRI
jgi:hypothetical protein